MRLRTVRLPLAAGGGAFFVRSGAVCPPERLPASRKMVISMGAGLEILLFVCGIPAYFFIFAFGEDRMRLGKAKSETLFSFASALAFRCFCLQELF